MNNKGEGYIDVCITTVVVAFCVFFLLTIAATIQTKFELAYVAETILEEAAKNGSVGRETEEKVKALEKELGYSVNPIFLCDYLNEEQGTIQLGDSIQLTVSRNITLQGFLGFELPVELTVTREAKSRMYHK